MTRFTLTLTAVIALSTTVAFGGEWIVFSEELPPGADLALRGDSQFVVGNSHPYQGANHLERDFATWGSWAWITGIMNLNLDLSGIDFDTAYIEFYIDSGTIPIGYLELRLGGAAWDPDFQNTSVTVDDQPGYELVKVMLKDFIGTSSGVSPTNLDEFTGGTGMIDRISWGFGAAGDLFIDEVRILDAAGGVTSIASHPVPAHGEADVSRDATLGWRPGQFANTHDVYLGAGFEDVNTASRQSPGGALVSQDQEGTTFESAGLLEFGTTYYWRIDEINAPPDSTVFKGDVWSFTVEPYGYPITPMAATAASFQTGMGPERTIDGSGLTGDVHGTQATTMWLSAGVQPNWIQYEFDQVYKLYELKVWNSNQLIESFLGFGAKNVTIETSTDGKTWMPVPDVPEFSQAPGAPGYAANTTISLGGTDAKFVKLTINTNWGGVTPQAGLAEVRFFYVPLEARAPEPADGATGVSLETALAWRPGREAASHQVCFGTDSAAVAAGTVAAETVSGHSFVPDPLTLGTQYYWKVDEVGTATYPGDVWSFTTEDYKVVDDFETYTSQAGEEVFTTWLDGFDDPTKNGAIVGLATAVNGTFCDTTTFHGGRKSMPFAYDNTKAPLSEAARTFDTAQDWTAAGIKTLVLFFYGDPANTGAGLYVKVNDSKLVYSGSADDILRQGWNQWNVDLSGLPASTLRSVRTLTIGMTSGMGKLLIDDIRLYRVAPALPATP